MLKTDIGAFAYHKGVGVATLSYEPQTDRAAKVTRVLVDKPSADDTWILSINGAERSRFPIYTEGEQQFLGGTAASFAKNRDLFSYYRAMTGNSLFYPVPNGQSITIASSGGATADVVFEYSEYDNGDVLGSALNGPNSNRFIVPLFGAPPNNVTNPANGEVDIVTQIGPSFFPNLFKAGQLAAGVRVSILALFLDGAGVNTFNGAADHQSKSDHIGFAVNSRRMFTRDANDGIPLVGAVSAAGSANTVYGADFTPFPAFQNMINPEDNWLEQPITLNVGDNYEWIFGVTGSSTGGADYSKALQAMLVDLTFTGGV